MTHLHKPLAIDVTRCIKEYAAGDEGARNELFQWTERRLRGTASAIRKSRWNAAEVHTSTLLQETFLTLEMRGLGEVGDREHFSKLATKVMRDLLVNLSKRASRQKRTPVGGFVSIDELNGEQTPRTVSSDLVQDLQLDQALDYLGARHPDLFETLMFHAFYGYSLEDTGKMTGCSLRTAERRLRTARAMMHSMVERAAS